MTATAYLPPAARLQRHHSSSDTSSDPRTEKFSSEIVENNDFQQHLLLQKNRHGFLRDKPRIFASTTDLKPFPSGQLHQQERPTATNKVPPPVRVCRHYFPAHHTAAVTEDADYNSPPPHDPLPKRSRQAFGASNSSLEKQNQQQHRRSGATLVIVVLMSTVLNMAYHRQQTPLRAAAGGTQHAFDGTSSSATPATTSQQYAATAFTKHECLRSASAPHAHIRRGMGAMAVQQKLLPLLLTPDADAYTKGVH